MAQYRSTEIRVGIFVLVCLVLTAGMILKFGKYERLGKKSYEITVIFPQAGGIVKKAKSAADIVSAQFNEGLLTEE